jgi:hypothetical protein
MLVRYGVEKCSFLLLHPLFLGPRMKNTLSMGKKES